jgi:uncharacterized protein (DUF433 family)
MAATLHNSSRPSLNELVEKDPAKLGGEPLFRGTRVPINSLFDYLRAGDSLDIFLNDFPGVSRDQAEAVLKVAGLHLPSEARNR